jgi:hypothetical protein
MNLELQPLNMVSLVLIATHIFMNSQIYFFIFINCYQIFCPIVKLKLVFTVCICY